jgi:hypothetical protein
MLIGALKSPCLLTGDDLLLQGLRRIDSTSFLVVEDHTGLCAMLHVRLSVFPRTIWTLCLLAAQ